VTDDDQDRPITPEDIVRGIHFGLNQGYMVTTPAMQERMEEIMRDGGDVGAYVKEMIALKEAAERHTDLPPDPQ
jgi:hypothetical protein